MSDRSNDSRERPGHLRKLREAGLLPRRALGQHFLLDPSILASIADAGCIEPQDTVLEVGIGLGSLTRILCERAQRVVAVELDEAMVRYVRPQLEKFSGLQIVTGDILAKGSDVHPEVLAALSDASRVKLIANLPFQVATRLLLVIFRVLPSVSTAVVIVQREVARRLVAEPCSKEYGPAGLLLGFWCKSEQLRDLPPGAFRPAPKVSASVVRICRRLSPRMDAGLYPAFAAWVDRLFQSRRKQVGGLLRRDLGPEMAQEALQSMDVAPEARPENLAPDAFVTLAQRYPLT